MKFLFSFLVMMHFAQATGNASNTYYRVLHSAPSEIMSAIFSSYIIKDDKHMTSGQSRLQKYFKIKNKVIRDNQVTVEIHPSNVDMGTYLPVRDYVRVTIDRQIGNSKNNQFLATIELTENLKIKSAVELVPHISGSLMSIKILDQNLSPKLTQLSVFTLKQLGFIYDSPEEAASNNN